MIKSKQPDAQGHEHKAEGEGQAAATKLEGAYRSNDGDAYSKMMKEVSREIKSFGRDKGAAEAYTKALTKKLEDDGILGRISLFETQRDFVDFNPANAKQAIEAGLKGKNPVQQALLKNAEGYYDSSSDGKKGTGDGAEPPAKINWDQLSRNDAMKAAMGDIFSPRSDGPSLYDRMRDAKGDIPPDAVQKLLNTPGIKLSDDDRRSLQLLDGQMTYTAATPDGNVYSTSLGMTRSQLEQLAAKSGAEVPPVEPVKKPDSDSPPGAHVDSTPDKKGEQIKSALTIESGGSYAQSAARLLELSGHKKFTGAELRHVAHLLWLADHRRKAKGLKSGQVLTISPEMANDPLLEGLFRQ
ncbi:MAG TPA: hypothetical protein V6C69_12810 [Trichormus sp.]|jgi:hypothetical protein